VIESDSGVKDVVEVAPESSLGTGDVDVSGILRLMGSRNIAPNANVRILSGGKIILDSGVKVRIRSLGLGTNIFTSGLFTATNAPFYLASNGTFRLPATNLLPTISLTTPLDGASFMAGDTISMQAALADVDSYIARVEFHVNGAFFSVPTNTPFRATLTNAPGGTYPLQAVVHDDDGGVSTSSVVNVTVAPRINRIESPHAEIAVIEFNSLLNQSCVLQAADTLWPADWTNIANFSGDAVPRQLRVTNALPVGVNTRFYRLVVP